MTPFTFITTNALKIAEARRVFPDILHEQRDLPELQSLRLETIVEAKLDAAIAQGARSIFVEDTSLTIDGLRGLPGPFIKWFLETLGAGGVAQIALASGSPRAVATQIIGAVLDDGRKVFTKGSVAGTIVSPRGRDFGWNSIFLPDGRQHTFGEMDAEERAELSMRTIALRELAETIGER